jgi:hypothetical protein
MPSYDWDDDSLDADGYPTLPATGLRYRRGSEAEAGGFKPIALGDAASKIVRKMHLFSVDLSRDRTGQ